MNFLILSAITVYVQIMKFCVRCDNVYYLRYVQNDAGEIQLQFECRHCRHVDETNEATSIMVLNSESVNTREYASSITEYTKYDPTVPRLYNIPCPNENCPSHAETSMPEILYVREHHEKMNYVYMCCVCDHVWKQSMSYFVDSELPERVQEHHEK